MINTDKILETFDNKVALWLPIEAEPTDLAQAASVAIEKNISVMSVSSDSVSIVWPWLENKNVKIFSRFYLNRQDLDELSNLTEKINLAFKRGADGAQIFVPKQGLETFVSQLYMIRDDLFFNKDLFIGIDINEIEPFEWKNVFMLLKKMRTTGIILALPRDSGDKSDFVGRVYAALESVEGENKDLDFHFLLGNSFVRIEQSMRLIDAMQPELSEKTRFFINC